MELMFFSLGDQSIGGGGEKALLEFVADKKNYQLLDSSLTSKNLKCYTLFLSLGLGFLLDYLLLGRFHPSTGVFLALSIFSLRPGFLFLGYRKFVLTWESIDLFLQSI